MATNKTTVTDADVMSFLDTVANDQRRADAQALLKLFTDISGCEPKMYGPSIIGFGIYHYKYASGHGGEAPLLAFAPRKDALVFYTESEFEGRDEMLAKLGKHRVSKACIYVRKLEDIDIDIMRQFLVRSLALTRSKHPGWQC